MVIKLSISPVDFVKLINMSYYGNNPEKYTLIAKRDRLRLKKYVDNLAVSNINGGGFSLKNLVGKFAKFDLQLCVFFI